MMKKVVGYNVLVLVLYTLMVFVAHRHDDAGGLGIILTSAFLVLVHFGLVFIGGIIVLLGRKNKTLGQSLLLSAGLVLLLGFSACLGSAALAG